MNMWLNSSAVHICRWSPEASDSGISPIMFEAGGKKLFNKSLSVVWEVNRKIKMQHFDSTAHQKKNTHTSRLSHSLARRTFRDKASSFMPSYMTWEEYMSFSPTFFYFISKSRKRALKQALIDNCPNNRFLPAHGTVIPRNSHHACRGMRYRRSGCRSRLYEMQSIRTRPPTKRKRSLPIS